MTYAANESSVEDGSPVYKFLFTQGTTEYKYTSASYFISDTSGTWEPVALSASTVTQSGEMAKNGIKIDLPRTNTVAALFLGGVPEQTMTLTVYRNHAGLAIAEEQIYWKGRIASASASGDVVTLNCEDIFTSMRRPGLRARYQKGCRHALYSSACGVDKADFDTAATVASEAGFNITVTIGVTPTGYADGYYAGGFIELADGSARYITAHTGSTLTLISPFNVGIVGDSVLLYPGCLHTTADCNAKFNNLLNYGGFPFIPGKNPFSNNVSGSIA